MINVQSELFCAILYAAGWIQQQSKIDSKVKGSIVMCEDT